MDIHEFKKFELLPTLKIHERITSGMIKFIGYGVGFLTCLPMMIMKGSLKTSEAFRQQAYSYVENGETVYRRDHVQDDLPSEFRGMKTVSEAILKVLSNGGDLPVIGYRKLIKEHIVMEGSTKKTLLELDTYHWLSYNQVQHRIMAVCQYFKSLNLGNGRNIALFAETSQDWLIVAFAAMLLNSVLVTVYNTLTDENIIHAFEKTKPVAILVDQKSSARLNAIIDKLPYIETIIYTSRCPRDIMNVDDDSKLVHTNVNTLYESEVDVQQMRQNLTPQSPEDVLLIMFTSGSMGVPKGVVIRHKNIVAVMAGSESQAHCWRGQTLMSYLPLAHILEIICELAIFLFGGKIGYGSPTTLFENGPMLFNGTKNDLAELQPTCMACVPMIMERVYKGILEKLKSASRFKQLIFQESYNLRAYFHARGIKTPIINRLIFNKIHKIFGGKLKFALVGGAYLSPEIEEFFNIVFPPFKQAYGTTEITCAGTMSNVSYHRPNNIGPPLACTELKLIPWPEGGYEEDGPNITKGELLVSGPAVCHEYFMDENQTNEAFILDPVTNKIWFRTADIAEKLEDGTFRIIARKSEIVKLTHGEYVELPKIDSAISASKYVDFVCVTANKEFNGLLAIISLNKKNVFELAGSMSLQNEDFVSIAGDSGIVKTIETDIGGNIEALKLNKFEIPKSFIITVDQWTPETGLLTPSLKVRRAAVVKHYQDLIK